MRPGKIVALALFFAWTIVITALAMGHNGIVASAGIAGIVTLGELARILVKKGVKAVKSDENEVE